VSAHRLHADEVDIDGSLVRRLLEEQFPQWASLAIARVPSAGTDNAIFRLGIDMAVRLPRHSPSVAPLNKETAWLPKLATHLPLPVPVPLAKGAPSAFYPFPWAVFRWLPGENAIDAQIADRHAAAVDLARFIAKLQWIDAADGPPPGPHNAGRGAPLAWFDPYVRRAVEEADDVIDGKAVIAIWNEALLASQWQGPPLWIHGDLHAGNLLVEHGRISAVIDFGCLGVGDPACDLMVAWSLLSADSRATFRRVLDIDDASWARGRGWALTAVIGIPYYRDTSPVIVANARRTIAEVLSEQLRKGAQGPPQGEGLNSSTG
jgi:aminoglycoside phosphotransferase (APT) family kinase protein